jgi:protein ERP2
MPSWIIWAFVGCMGLRSAQRDVVARPDDPTSWTEPGVGWQDSLLAILGLAVVSCRADEHAFTYRLPPRHEECFYFEVKQGQSIELEFQVVSGGNLDLDYTLASPRGNIIERVSRQQDHLYEGNADQTGDYRMCLGNLFSSVTTKEVFILIMTDLDADDSTNESPAMSSDNAVDDAQVTNINEIGGRMYKFLYRAQSVQDHLRARENRHRKTAKSNLSRINWISMIHTTTIVLVGFLQVVAVRRFFAPKKGGK